MLNQLERQRACELEMLTKGYTLEQAIKIARDRFPVYL